MHVIAGLFKGRRLVTPRGRLTRPTADHVRLALMDALMPWLPGARLLDLYAGAGGVGLEALSRGAARATFVERDPQALRALRANIAALRVADRCRVLRQDTRRALETLGASGERFNVIFLDPPYDAPADPVLDRITRAGLVDDAGVVVVQHFSKLAPRGAYGGLATWRTRRFGETTLTFFRAQG